MEKPVSNRTNGKMCESLVRETYFFGNAEFEALEHENLTLHKSVDNNTGRHMRGRGMILGDSYRTSYSEVEKNISINSYAFFSLNISRDTIRTMTMSAHPAIKRDKVDEADGGQGGPPRPHQNRRQPPLPLQVT